MALLGALAIAPLAATPTGAQASERSLTALVSPLSGTFGDGLAFPGALLPGGMVQVGPDTESYFAYNGYQYTDTEIHGFSLVHLSGAGIPIAGDISLMPTVGPVETDPVRYQSPFSHATEAARPGYMRELLARYATKVEMTAGVRTGWQRYTFPPVTDAHVLVNPSLDRSAWNDRVTGRPGVEQASVTVIPPDAVSGWEKSTSGYKVYFYTRFSSPFGGYQTWNHGTLSGAASATGAGVGAALNFNAAADPVLTSATGISYVSVDQAQGNLDAEAPQRLSAAGFDGVARGADRAWNRALESITIEGGTTEERSTFYDNLYRALEFPSVFSDSNGLYLGFDGQVHQAAGYTQYSNFSNWDVYRTQMPLLDLIDPQRVHDVMLSYLADYQQRGTIPRWVQANLDYGIMGGDSGSIVVAQAIADGIVTGTPADALYAAIVKQGETMPPLSPREHLDAYVKGGYIPNDVSGIGTSETQEYAIADCAISLLAHSRGDTSTSQLYAPRAGYWRNVFDPDPGQGWIRPRNSDRSWANPTPDDPTAVLPSQAQHFTYNPAFEDGYSEGTGWQYLWLEPQNPTGLFAAIDSSQGKGTAVRRLDTFFSEPLTAAPLVVPTAQQYASFFGLYYVGDQYTPANEPDLQAPSLYDWAGQPWKTQQVTRALLGAYNPRPDGLPGDDDLGETSSWYVVTALGFYPVMPAARFYALGSPLFNQAQIRLAPPWGSGAFTISASAASNQNRFIQSASLDGAPLDAAWIPASKIAPGGALQVTMGPTANTSWAAGAAGTPPSACPA